MGDKVTNRSRVTQYVNLRHLQQRGNTDVESCHTAQCFDPMTWLQSGMLPCLLLVSWGTGNFAHITAWECEIEWL